MTETKQCARCARAFPRHPKYSARQWAEQAYCSRTCSSLAAKVGRPVLWALFERVTIDPDSQCWTWGGARDGKGYGLVTFDGKTDRAHRLAYRLARGPIADGKLILHRCDNPPCCNPTHLFVGTDKDNSDDKRLKGRDRTLRGEASPNARLTELEVVMIRSDRRPQDEIARDYGIAQTTVSAIKTGRNWSHTQEGNG